MIWSTEEFKESWRPKTYQNTVYNIILQRGCMLYVTLQLEISILLNLGRPSFYFCDQSAWPLFLNKRKIKSNCMTLWQKFWNKLLLTIITPVGVPGVGTKPVGNSIFNPPAQDLDGMPSHSRPWHMLIHSCVKQHVRETSRSRLSKKVSTARALICEYVFSYQTGTLQSRHRR